METSSLELNQSRHIILKTGAELAKVSMIKLINSQVKLVLTFNDYNKGNIYLRELKGRDYPVSASMQDNYFIIENITIAEQDINEFTGDYSAILSHGKSKLKINIEGESKITTLEFFSE